MGQVEVITSAQRRQRWPAEKSVEDKATLIRADAIAESEIVKIADDARTRARALEIYRTRGKSALDQERMKGFEKWPTEGVPLPTPFPGGNVQLLHLEREWERLGNRGHPAQLYPAGALETALGAPQPLACVGTEDRPEVAAALRRRLQIDII